MLANKEVVLKVDDATIMNCDEIIHKALNNDMVVDISIQGSMEGEHGGPHVNNNINIANNQDSLEDEFADVVEDIAWVKSHVLVKDPGVVCTDNELLKVDDQMLNCSNEKTVIAKTSEVHLTNSNGPVRVKLNSSSIAGTFHNQYVLLQLHGAAGCWFMEKGRTWPLHTIGSLAQPEVQLTALNNKVQTLQRDKDILKTNLSKAEELTALNNKVQALQRDMEILKTNLNKAEKAIDIEAPLSLQLCFVHATYLLLSEHQFGNTMWF